MTIKGGGHVSINGIAYLLDEATDGHYVHSYPSLEPHRFIPRVQGTATSGTPAKEEVRIQRLVWSMTDWVGGEGNRVYYEDQPNTYDNSVALNTRIPGQVTARPQRTRATVATADNTQYTILTGAIAKLWLFGSTKCYNGDGDATWSANLAPTLPTSHAFTAATGDDGYIYASSWKTGGGASNNRLMMYTADGTTWQNLLVTETISATATTEASKNAYAALAVHNGRLYGWTGRRLFAYDVANITGANSLTADQNRKVYDTGSDFTANVFGNLFWAEMVDCGTSLVFFQSTPGRSTLYQHKAGVSRPIWAGKPGYTVKSIAHSDGIVYISGTYSAASQGATPGHGAIYALPLDTLRPIFLKWVRKTIDKNLQMQECHASVGNQVVICAAHTGRMFVYDADYNGFTMLDDIGSANETTQEVGNESGGNLSFTSNDHRIGDTLTWGKFRVFTIYRPGTAGTEAYQTLHYANDEPTQRMTTATNSNLYLDSPEHDFEFPDQQKALLGVHVLFQPEGATTSGLLANQRIVVQYALDKGQSPTWTTAQTITSATTPSGTLGRVFVDLTATTLKFFRLRVRIILDNNNTAGVKPPIVLDISPEAEVLAYDETYDLVVRIKDEQDYTRPSTRASKSNLLRDNLVTLRTNKNIVSFIDGYRYRDPGRVAATQKVFIDDLTDVISRNAEGVMKVRLRVVPV